MSFYISYFFAYHAYCIEQVVLSSTEVKSLQSELADLEERESHSRAQLEHIDEVLRTCYLSGYLHMRTRWAALPGEPLPLDDTDVDDWLPRFVVLHGSCIFLYFMSTDLSPQDSTLLSDIVEVGPMPCDTKEDGETLHYFYILTRYGLRYECSCTSKIQPGGYLASGVTRQMQFGLMFKHLQLLTRNVTHYWYWYFVNERSCL
ncbi:uncharacterized protein [Rutidosis leptorrhynchoides]|uniref:uncharacterized protein n=1 Tax=Rutidosis leptorrhynchoides TaxID=125765 RepID=UPI003A99980B